MRIRPTSRGWVVSLAGVLFLLIAFANRSVFSFLLAAAILGLTFSGLLCALVSLRKIGVERGTTGDVTAGQAVSMPLLIRNALSRTRQVFLVREQVPFAPQRDVYAPVAALAAREERTVDRRVLAIRRGEYDLGPVILRGADPAGLFYRERVFRLPLRITVLPGIEPVPDLLLRQHETIHSIEGRPVSAAGMSQEFFGVREYHPADGLRDIHWRSSARRGRLMVREYERNAVMSVAVMLDANEHFVSGDDQWSNLEYLIRTAASISTYCSDLYCSFALAAGGDRPIVLPPRPAAEVHREVLYELARLKPGRASLVDSVYEVGRLLPRDSVVFCLSMATPRPLQDALEVFCRRGMNVRWYCARREAFAGGGKGQATGGSGLVADRAPLFDIAHLRPGMRLEEALAFRGSPAPAGG